MVVWRRNFVRIDGQNRGGFCAANEGQAMKLVAAVVALSLLCANAASAQQRGQDQSDWPCRQVKVPSIAIASVWTGPSIEEALKTWREDHVISDLVARISVRKTPLEAAEAMVRDFAKSAGEKRQERLTMLFAGVYERLESERREVIAGLDRFGRKQKDLAEQLRKATQDMRAEQDKAGSNPEKLKELSESLQWNMRIFDERRQAVTYVCETPALIEQRLGALAREILAAM
jgi:hypothetical protein